MPSKYQKYDITAKVSYVEEYLEQCKTTKITKADFAFEKGLSDSTFNDWVVKYLKDKDRFINGASVNDDISISSYTKPTFIELSKDNIASKPLTTNNVSNNSNIKLSYKDVTIEFSDNQLDKVMEILRRW